MSTRILEYVNTWNGGELFIVGILEVGGLGLFVIYLHSEK